MAATATKPRKGKKASKAPSGEENSAFKKVGRLASFGLSEQWQMALLMPTGYDDLRHPLAGAHLLAEGARGLLWLCPISQPSASFTRGVPRTRVEMRDATGQVLPTTTFGDTKEWAERLVLDNPGWYLCESNTYRDELQLRVAEQISNEWIGRMRPRYAGKPNYLHADKVRSLVHNALPKALPMAAAWIQEQLQPVVDIAALLEAAGLPGWAIVQVLEEAHLPTSPGIADKARTALRRIAAFAALAKVHAHILSRMPARAFTLSTTDRRIAALPYTLTTDQTAAIARIAADLAKPEASRAVLVGDVGSGKTAVFSTIVAALVDAGGRAAILLPNLPLAEQVCREIATTWPDLAPRLVTGGGNDDALDAERVLVGTTALLHRATGQLDLVVVDEEQKFSVEQREQLTGTTAHLLTSSATCIPRSQALARYGALSVSELRQGHADKQVQTRLWQYGERTALFGELRAQLAAGAQLLVVYPMREPGETSTDPRHAVEQALSGWEVLCPGKVRCLTGKDSDTEKSDVMRAMRSGQAQVLLATTVVEVGITLPALRRVMIVAPDRYGLTTLHQLRGRVARHGGNGWCDLYAAAPLSDKANERLTAFLACNDGFAVAELDLALRGFGDLAQGATQQSGSDNDILFGDGAGPEDIAAMEELWRSAAATMRSS